MPRDTMNCRQAMPEALLHQSESEARALGCNPKAFMSGARVKTTRESRFEHKGGESGPPKTCLQARVKTTCAALHRNNLGSNSFGCVKLRGPQNAGAPFPCPIKNQTPTPKRTLNSHLPQHLWEATWIHFLLKDSGVPWEATPRPPPVSPAPPSRRGLCRTPPGRSCRSSSGKEAERKPKGSQKESKEKPKGTPKPRGNQKEAKFGFKACFCDTKGIP